MDEAFLLMRILVVEVPLTELMFYLGVLALLSKVEKLTLFDWMSFRNDGGW